MNDLDGVTLTERIQGLRRRAEVAEAELAQARQWLSCWQALFGEENEDEAEGFMNETRAWLGEVAP